MIAGLRGYQDEIVAEVRAHMRAGVKSILVQSPTGSGKTVLVAYMLATAAAKNMDSVFCVHRRELVKQSIRTFNEVGVQHGVISAGFEPDPRPRVQVASVQTLARRVSGLRRPRLFVWDESHHLAAGSWTDIYRAFPDAFHIGLTATPERLDGQGLGKYFGVMVRGPSVAWLIEHKFLSPYKLYAPGTADLAGVHTRMGDFAKNEAAAAVDKPTITGDAIKHYLKFAGGKRAVLFAVSVEHSKHVVQQFRAAGIAAEHVDGETDADSRDAAIRRFASGETLVLSNVELFGEGFDLPAIEAAILLRPTQSLGLYLQQVGRALRPSPGKSHAIILDHVGNCERHGLPDDEREWSLDGASARKKGEGSTVKVKLCPKCFAAQPPGPPRCRHCGFTFPAAPRVVEEKEGELVELDPEAIRRKRAVEQSGANSLEDLIALGVQRGYKKPEAWAKHVFNARQARKLQQGRQG
jgi:DNA repair protein RadD